MARLKQCSCGNLHKEKRCPICVKRRRQSYDRTRRNPVAKSFYNSPFWRSLREACGERDKYVCQMCGHPAGKSFHADHIVPREDGGADELDNLQTLCDKCHGRKTSRELQVENASCYLVSGPPCSGKSTWVRQRIKDGDLVFDLDRIKQAITGQPLHVPNGSAVRIALAMWAAAMKELKRRPASGVTYIETTEPDAGRRRHWCGELVAREVVIPTDLDTCLVRLEASPERMHDRDGIETRIRAWFTS